jgi:hypothetical protein
MKAKVSLSDSTMPSKRHWLEFEHDGDYYVSLRTATNILGDGRTKIAKVILQNMKRFSPGVIIQVGPLHFYRTEDDVRVSFDESEAVEEGLSGYDRVDHEELIEAIDKVLGREPHARPRKKKAASKPKRRVASASKNRAK